MLTPVIMAGGAGSRLWPLSRRMLPKQFLSLSGGKESMFQETLQRLEGLAHSAAIVVCNEDHRFLVAEQLLALDKMKSTIMLEPVGRNTAPAIAVAAFQALKDDDDPLLLVLSADHIIAEQLPFHTAIRQAEQLALADHIVTFGIVPNSPEIGYGYIHRGEAIGDGFKVARFVEKPDLDTATEYLATGEYYWNSGMFLFRASRFLEELENLRPEIVAACRTAVEQGQEDLDFSALIRNLFRLARPNLSTTP